LRKREFYNQRSTARTLVKVLLIVLLVLVVLAVFLFFFLQRYIVYTADGLRLELPILNQAASAVVN